jgi:hypothetical protein
MRSIPRLRPLSIAGALILVLILTMPGFAAGPYYARGDYFAGTGGTWGTEAGNQLFDDGLHGDGAAGDGVYGANVVSDQPAGIYGFKIANSDWSEAWPSNPTYALSNAVVWTSGPGDVVHFSLDTNLVGDGWQPAQNAVATDHFAPHGTAFEVIGSAPETGNWNSGVAAGKVGSLMRVEVQIATPGSYQYKFRATGTWDVCNFGVHYNMFNGDNFTYTTTLANAYVRFEMDLATGRGRAVESPTTDAKSSTWGRIKRLYR